MVKVNLIIPILLLTIISCVALYKSYLTISINHNKTRLNEVINIIESTAKKHKLSKDIKQSIEGKELSYFGRPYHYYTFKILVQGEKIQVDFLHDARLVQSKNSGIEIKKSFIAEIKKVFHSYKIIEDQVIINKPE